MTDRPTQPYNIVKQSPNESIHETNESSSSSSVASDGSGSDHVKHSASATAYGQVGGKVVGGSAVATILDRDAVKEHIRKIPKKHRIPLSVGARLYGAHYGGVLGKAAGLCFGDKQHEGDGRSVGSVGKVLKRGISDIHSSSSATDAVDAFATMAGNVDKSMPNTGVLPIDNITTIATNKISDYGSQLSDDMHGKKGRGAVRTASAVGKNVARAVSGKGNLCKAVSDIDDALPYESINQNAFDVGATIGGAIGASAGVAAGTAMAPGAGSFAGGVIGGAAGAHAGGEMAQYLAPKLKSAVGWARRKACGESVAFERIVSDVCRDRCLLEAVIAGYRELMQYYRTN